MSPDQFFSFKKVKRIAQNRIFPEFLSPFSAEQFRVTPYIWE